MTLGEIPTLVHPETLARQGRGPKPGTYVANDLLINNLYVSVPGTRARGRCVSLLSKDVTFVLEAHLGLGVFPFCCRIGLSNQ